MVAPAPDQHKNYDGSPGGSSGPGPARFFLAFTHPVFKPAPRLLFESSAWWIVR
jgi:hypothetical protein